MATSSGSRGTAGQQQDRANQRDRDRANPAGDRGTKSQQQDRRNMDAARRAGNAAPGVGANANRGTLAQQQDRINTNRALARSNTAPGVGNYSDAMNDYNNVGQGFFDDPLGAIGRFFGSGFGVGEIDPRTQANKSFIDRTTASWGIDPIGAALGVGGSFFGPAGTLVSGLYNRGKTLAGVQGPMIAFDGNQPVTGGFPSFGGFGGGAPQPGGGTGMANAGNMGGVLSPPQAPQAAGQTSGQAPGQAPSGMGQPQYPAFQWAQPWPGSQPTMGGPLSSWNMPYQPSQQQQQPWSNGLMAPQQSWGSGWR